MRDYAKISPKFWIDQKGREIRKLGLETQCIALYLMSCPNSTMIGIYYLPITFIAHETGIDFKKALKAIQNLCDLGFCHYDADLEYVWIVNMAQEQMDGQLKQNDSRVKFINDAYQELPELLFLSEFFDYYEKLLLLEHKRESRRSSTAPSTPTERPQYPLSATPRRQKQEQEQKQKQEQEQEQEINIVAPTRRCDEFSSESEIEFIFSHWKSVMNHPNAILDEKRRKLIKHALKLGYTTEQICNAITGCSLTPYNMGDNDRGQRYDGLHVILRDADQIDRFIANFNSPPCPPNPADKLIQSNWAASQRWLASKMQEITPDETE